MVVLVLFESNRKISINTKTKGIDGSKEGLKRTKHTGALIRLLNMKKQRVKYAQLYKNLFAFLFIIITKSKNR